MATIKEDYVSFDLAKLLKEKGFDEKCLHWYVANEPQEGVVERGFGKNQFYINAPTQQMARKWLREVHYIYADPIKQGNYNDCSEYYTWIVACMGIIHRNSSVADKLSYKEACEAAIKYALENLI